MTPSSHRSTARSIPCWLGMVLFGAWCVGQIFRDLTWTTGLCFYLPSPVVFGTLVLLSLGLAWRGSRQGMWLVLGMAIGPAIFVAWIENRFSPASRSRISSTHEVGADSGQQAKQLESVRIVHWNVCWGRRGWEGNVATIKQLSPDLVVVSERPMYARTLSLLDALGPEYHAYDLRKTVVICRGKVDHLRSLVQTRRSEIFLFDWQSDNQTVRVMTVDLASDIFMARDPGLVEVTRWMATERPDIVVGDFNAPRRSNRLSSLPADYRHAYDEVGSGWSYTWPHPFPLYAIDQCILGRRITPTSYQIQSSPYSDHRLQILEYRICETNSETEPDIENGSFPGSRP